MALHYNCKHCGVRVGSLEQKSIHSTDIGLQHLTNEERQEMVEYQANGDIHIKTICEDCQEALERNPDLYQYEKFIN